MRLPDNSSTVRPVGWRRFDSGLSRLVVVTLVALIGAAALLPVYSDEIGWRFQERAAIDGVDSAYTDRCGPNTLARPSWFMMPARWFSATVNQALANPLFVRLEGVACALAWLLMVWVLAGRLEADPVRRTRLRALAFALLGLGTLPLLLVISRPEQPMLLTLTLTILIALAPGGGTLRFWLKGAAIVVLTAVSVSYNLKAVAYTAVPLAGVWIGARGQAAIMPRLAAAGALVAIVASGASYWVARFRCPAAPDIAAKLSEENLAAALSNGTPWTQVALAALQGANPVNYIKLAALKNASMSSWIPVDLFPTKVPGLSATILVLVWSAAIGLALIMAVRFIAREQWRAMHEPRLVLAAAILASVLAWGASQVNRNVYEAAHVLPMLVVFIVLCMTLPNERPSRIIQAERWLPPLIATVAIISQITLVSFVARPLIAAAHTPGVPVAQPFSVSVAGYGHVRSDVAQAMSIAGIDPAARQPGLVVDDLTYLALQAHPRPYHRLGVIDFRQCTVRPEIFLVSRGSPGIVSDCLALPADLRLAAARAGQVCALSARKLGQIGVTRARLTGL